MRRLHRELRKLLAPGPRKAARHLSRLFYEAQGVHPLLEPVVLEFAPRKKNAPALDVTVHHFPLREMYGLIATLPAVKYEYATECEPG
jgi:hypothetical protein